ncbi:MAG TPA: hypothetical protein EYG79_12180 [Rhodobacteraceae bacterium]|nr:hypothetical protein [Paracoccaceae bacterium]
MAKLKYKFDNTSKQPLTVRGAALKKGHWVGIKNDQSNFRNTSPVTKVKVKKKVAFKFKTYVGDASMELNAEWHSEKYEVGNPDTGKPDIIWEVDKLYLFITKLELPTGYTIQVYCKPETVSNKGSGNVSAPLAKFMLYSDVGPMIGSWTKYKSRLTCDILGRKFK